MKSILLVGQLILCITFGVAQEKPDVQFHRYFWDLTPMLGIDDYLGKAEKIVHPDGSVSVINPSSYVGGLQFKMGNNWYLQKGKFNGLLRLTWFRVGFFLGEGAGLITTPLHVSLGHHFQLTETFSIVPMLSGGPIILIEDPLFPSWVITYTAMPEIRFNFNHFSIGAEYTFKPFYTSYSKELNGFYHYIGLSVGKQFGEMRKKSGKR